MNSQIANSVSIATHEKDVQTSSGLARIVYLSCGALTQAGFKNAFSTRHGGVSQPPKNDLNLAYGKEDNIVVEENRRRFFAGLDTPIRPVITAHQIHSDRLHFLEAPLASARMPALDRRAAPREDLEGDVLASADENVWLGIKTADCLPLLLGDPNTGWMAAVHAGWRGTVARVAEKTVSRLVRQKNVDPKNIIAALGPSACGDCYEVGEDVANKVKTELKSHETYLKPKGGGKFFLDVALANVRQLLDAGLHPANVHASTHCTMHQNQHFFSHRKEGKTESTMIGRMLAVIGK